MTVEEIRAIRIAEYERTKNMNNEELLEDSLKKGGDLFKRLMESKKQKNTTKK